MSDTPSETNLDEDAIFILAAAVFGFKIDNGLDAEEKKALKRLSKTIKRDFALLDERERELLKMRYGLAPYGERHTLEETGEAFNVTRERVRQIEARAMSKLRHPYPDTGARDLLST